MIAKILRPCQLRTRRKNMMNEKILMVQSQEEGAMTSDEDTCTAPTERAATWECNAPGPACTKVVRVHWRQPAEAGRGYEQMAAELGDAVVRSKWMRKGGPTELPFELLLQIRAVREQRRHWRRLERQWKAQMEQEGQAK